jgi:WD40 repeat protein
LQVSIEKKDKLRLCIYTLAGRLIQSTIHTLEPGMYSLALPIQGRGCFLIRCAIGDQTFQFKHINRRADIPTGAPTIIPVVDPRSAGTGLKKTLASGGIIDSLIFIKPGYKNETIGVAATAEGITVSMHPLVLSHGVNPGLWTGKTSQGYDYAIGIRADGRTIDSLLITAYFSCSSLGGVSFPFVFRGPFTIPENGIVSIGDSVSLAFTDSTVSGTFASKMTPTNPGGGCRREYWVLYNSGWRKEGYETDPNQLVYLREPVTFTNRSYAINLTALNGSVEKNPDKSSYGQGDRVALHAVPNPDYHFLKWNGDVAATSDRYAWVLMLGTESVEAVFEKDFALATPVVNGSVVKFPDQSFYKPGETVKVVSRCSTSSCIALRWTGDTLRTSRDTAWVVMTADKTVSPVFGEVSYLRAYGYRVDVEPRKEYYLPAEKDTVRLVAHSDSLYRFTEWSGPVLKASHDTAWVVMDVTKTIEAKNIDAHVTAMIALPVKYSTIAFSGDGLKLLWVSAYSDTAKMYDPATGALINSFPLGASYSPSFAPDGSKFLVCIYPGVKIVDAGTGAVLGTISIRTVSGNYPLFSPDGESIVIGTMDSTAQLWRVSDATLLRTLSGHTGIVQNAAFSTDGQSIATVAMDSSIIVWRAATGEKIKRIPVDMGWTKEPKALSFSPDNGSIRLLLADGKVRRYNVASGALTDTLITALTPECAKFSNDGTLLAIGTWNRGGAIFDLAGGNPLRFIGSSSPMSDVAISGNKKYAARTASDSTLIIWKLQ